MKLYSQPKRCDGSMVKSYWVQIPAVRLTSMWFLYWCNHMGQCIITNLVVLIWTQQSNAEAKHHCWSCLSCRNTYSWTVDGEHLKNCWNFFIINSKICFPIGAIVKIKLLFKPIYLIQIDLTRKSPDWRDNILGDRHCHLADIRCGDHPLHGFLVWSFHLVLNKKEF